MSPCRILLACLVLLAGPGAAADAPVGRWSVALGAGAPLGAGAGVYRGPWYAEGAWQCLGTGPTRWEGQLRLAYFGSGAGNARDAYGTRFNAGMLGFSLGSDWLLHFGAKTGPGLYVFAGLGLGVSNTWFTYTSVRDPGTGRATATARGNEAVGGLTEDLGIGWRLTPRFRLEVRANFVNGLDTFNSDTLWDSTWNQEPRTATSLVAVLGRYRF